jgi:hypothetical protein
VITPCGGDGYHLFPEWGRRKIRYTFRCNCGFESEWLYKSADSARSAAIQHMNNEPAEEDDNACSEEASRSDEDPQDS